MPAMEDDESFNIGEYIATALAYKELIALVTLLALLLGAFYTYIAKPVYRADGLLQVEEEASGLAALDALQPLGEQTSSVNAELEILRSRMILGQVVDKLRLDQAARPDWFPVIGEPIARRYAGEGVSKPWLGQSQLAWGGESIEVQRLDVPRGLLGVPIFLVAGEAGHFTLSDETGSWSANGTVGERVQVELAGGELAVFVSGLRARPDTRFVLVRQPRNAAIADLAAQLSVVEKGRGSGIVELRLTGGDRDALPGVLDEIMNVYVRQNVERRSAEAESTLQFLETQLPALKEQLDASESAYNSYRLEEGSVDLTSETQSVLASVVQVDNELVGLQQEREELRQRFKSEHPRLRALDGKIARLARKRQDLDAQVAKLPGTQQKILRLKRDVEVNTRLYTELLNTAQQLRVSKAGTVGNVRVIDAAAVGFAPIAPRKGRILAVSLVLGLLASFVVIWLIRSLRVRVEHAEVIERALNLPVYATVPHSKIEVKLSKDVRHGRAKLGLLALEHADEDAVESLRSLRTTLRFAVAENSRPGILITGPSQGIGKSFISKNLAILFAQAHESVVLIDGDMRRGHLHREFGVARDKGLADYLSDNLAFGDVVKPTLLDGLDIVTCGTRPPNSSELLMNSRLDLLIQALATTYRHVIIDAPPILAVSDAATLGRFTGTVLMVARAGQHPVAELEQAVKRLALSGVRTNGFVLNDLDTVRLRYRYGYSGYHYQYKYKT